MNIRVKAKEKSMMCGSKGYEAGADRCRRGVWMEDFSQKRKLPTQKHKGGQLWWHMPVGVTERGRG